MIVTHARTKQSMLATASPFMKVMNGVNLMYFQIVVTQSHNMDSCQNRLQRQYKTDDFPNFPTMLFPKFNKFGRLYCLLFFSPSSYLCRKFIVMRFVSNIIELIPAFLEFFVLGFVLFNRGRAPLISKNVVPLQHLEL